PRRPRRWGFCAVALPCARAPTPARGGGGGRAVLGPPRLGMGLAQAGMFPCATDTFSKWFPPTQRGFASGSLASAMSIGGAAGALLTGFFLPVIRWQWLYAPLALPGLVLAVLVHAPFPDPPPEPPALRPPGLPPRA